MPFSGICQGQYGVLFWPKAQGVGGFRFGTLLDLSVSSLGRGHAHLCIPSTGYSPKGILVLLDSQIQGKWSGACVYSRTLSSPCSTKASRC